MKRIIPGGFAALLTLAASVFGQNGAPVLVPGQGAGAPPAYALRHHEIRHRPAAERPPRR